MAVTFRLLCLINLWFFVCSAAAVISIGELSSGSTSSTSKDHFGSKNDIHVTKAQTNQYSRNLYEKSFKRYPFRAVAKRNLKSSFDMNTGIDAASLSGEFVTNSVPREGGKSMSEATVIGNVQLPEVPKIREKRCGKANAKLAKITGTLKSSKRMGSQYRSLFKTITSRSRMTKKYTGIKRLANALEANSAANMTNSSNYTLATLFSSTVPTDFVYTTLTVASTSAETANLVTSPTDSENISQTNSEKALNLFHITDDELVTENSNSTNSKDGLVGSSSSETMVGFMGNYSVDVSTAASAVSSSTTTEKSMEDTTTAPEETTIDSSTTDRTETTQQTLTFTSTETVVTESSTAVESNTSSVATMSTPSSSSTETDVTGSSTVSETDMRTTETTTSPTTTSSTETDVTGSSTVSETDTSMMEITTSSTTTSSTETESSTVSKTGRSTTETMTTTETTTEDFSETETMSTIETTPYSSTSITKEIKTTNLRSTENTVISSSHATEILSTKNFSDSSSEKTTNSSSLKTSTLSPAVVTKGTVSATISDMDTSSVVHSTEIELRSSTGEDWSSTVDELIEKKAALSPGKIAWIVIGILMVLAAFTGGIFFGHRYRTIYQKREDTIALVVRNHNRRSYY